HDKGLHLSNKGRAAGLKGSLLPDRRKPVHSGNIRPTGRSPSSSAKGTAYTEFRSYYSLWHRHGVNGWFIVGLLLF
ncbi:hypothetical protein, partial [Bacteroides heparinolyticus]|uniref:hypothetical protein n=1 Tax=Prevotella heparinolytica TaxID=28113 RepID=UPI0035A0FB98